MKKMSGLLLVAILFLTGCQEGRPMAPDDIQEEPTYATAGGLMDEE